MKDHATLRSLSALVASLPASESRGFREEFETVRCVSVFVTGYISPSVIPQEYEDVQLTAYLAALTKSSDILNEVRVSHSIREMY